MIRKKKIGDMLVAAKLLTDEQLAQALGEQKKSGLKLGQYLIQSGQVKEHDIIEMLSRQLLISRFMPDRYPLDLSLVSLIPIAFAQKYLVAPLKKKGRLLTVALADPLDISMLDALEAMTNCEADPVIASEREINQLISSLYGAQAGLGGVMETVEIETTTEKQAESPYEDDVKITTLEDLAEEAPVIRLVNSIFAQAVREGTSDIHLSPQKATMQIRFRIDGKLHEVPSPPKSLFLPIVARIKILAGMDITSSRMPQDGRFTLRMEKKEINVRASTTPTIYGENLVLRLLDMSAAIYSLENLGMTPPDVEKIKSMIVKPYGMILSTGPTGSGKSTSLYSILSELNKPDTNIITLEDPVEYRIEAIRQVQLNRKAGMTFADGLRSILRQDPDVIMVGEVRDAETAAIGVQAAMTGHRVLSTLHTNDAAGAVVRLIDMGIEPFLVSSVLLVSFAQRLVRTICPYCRETYRPPETALNVWGLNLGEKTELMRGKGCYQCFYTGYKGRTGIFEVLVNDDEIQELILKVKSAREITKAAIALGKLRTLKDDAAQKVLAGITTLDEAASAVMV